MSLYVGHLSPRVRQEDLERVFRRFGQCSIRLKDGYGFVIYESTTDAEKALWSLRGKFICGDPVSLNWSNKQPRPFQRSARNTQFNEPYHGGKYKEGYNGSGIRQSRDRRDFNDPSRVLAHNRGGLRLPNVFDKVLGGKSASLKDVEIDADGTREVNPVENDRWGEPASDTLTGHVMGNDSDYDRYEPYHGQNRKDKKEKNQTARSSGSYSQESYPEKGQREHSFDAERSTDKSKPHQACFNCGLIGHMMRNCPHGDAGRKKFSRFNHRRDEINFRDKGEGRVRRLRSNSRGRPSFSRDPLISRHHARDRKESYSGKARRVRNTKSLPESGEESRPKTRAESRGKKKRKLEHGIPRKVLRKRRSRRSGTSSLSSDSSTNSSQSHPKSSTSGISSRSRSKTPSSQSRSASSRSRPVSISSHSKSSSPRSRSMSRSGSSFLRSLSVSLDRKAPSPKSVHMNVHLSTSPKVSTDHVSSPKSKHTSLTNFGNSESIGVCSALNDENTVNVLEADCNANGDYSMNNCDNVQLSNMVGDEENNPCIDMLQEINITSGNHGEKSDLHGTISANQVNMEGPARHEATFSTRISTQEMLSALRHYGLAADEAKSAETVEGYFGAARLWPWEIIYYRRLKKGPISTENYARRIEQNREFGIVDKYIRSSSGWGECHQNDS